MVIFITMWVPQPPDVLPLLDGCVDPLYASLRTGIDYANDLQPDPEDREPWFWSHAARFATKRGLIAAGAPIVPKTANAGIHLTLHGIHTARVLRSLWGTAPHPGRNPARRESWVGLGQRQLSFSFPAPTGTHLPPLSLLLDWQVDTEGEPVVHCSLPIGSWKYAQRARLYWREPLRPPAGALSGLRFEAPDDGGEPQIWLDPTELEHPELG